MIETNLGFEVKVILDSVSHAGDRITTWEIRVPRIIWPQLLTHRMFSRNAQSNRAVPTHILAGLVADDPYIPDESMVGKLCKGMNPDESLPEGSYAEGVDLIQGLAKQSAWVATRLRELKWHKQHANRYLEPFQWIKALLTATHVDNFFEVRARGEGVQSETELVAQMLHKTWCDSKPETRICHAPYVATPLSVLEVQEHLMASAARCARVSYAPLTAGKEPSLRDDEEKGEVLFSRKHWSPFEHIAFSTESGLVSANFTGWRSFRHQLQGGDVK